MGTYLARWGFTAQKPLRRANEQDPAAVRRWLRRAWPAIAARGKAEGGTIFRGDGRTYASDGLCLRQGEEPSKYWLSNLPPRTTLKDLVHTAKARWLIERDYQELKQEIGLGYYEGRGWRGFHHHASLCIAAYGFLVAERCLFPPQARFTARRL